MATRLEQIGCDPITLMALLALGDVVTLGYMTKAEYEATAEIETHKGEAIIVRRSGMARAAATLPPAVRAKAAFELANYVWPKRSSVTMQNPDGSALQAPSAVLILPDNGRVPRQ